MTHKDIYEKFMIEYDKANITSSYPSLTEYEIATILDKAYLALIAQKLIGNNVRKVPFEGDIKLIEDLRPLIGSTIVDAIESLSNSYSDNDIVYDLPDILYYLFGKIKITKTTLSIDSKPHNFENVSLVPHAIAEKFMASTSNLPWINSPVSFIEGNTIHVLVDTYKYKNETDAKLKVTYLKKPTKFVASSGTINDKTSIFELSDTMAEELINLAIVMATNITESSRLLSLISQLNLES